ncbi:hypothetical protein, partial [Sphingobacterium spiritivorum]
ENRYYNCMFCYFLGYSTSILLVRTSTDASTAFAAVPTGNTIQAQAALKPAPELVIAIYPERG